MNFRSAVFWICSAIATWPALSQEVKPTTSRQLSLDEAVQLALKHNHVVRMATYHVQESEHAKEAARSSYLPSLRNDTNAGHLTDTQFIAIPEGSLANIAGTPIPERTAVLNQGGLTFVTSGTQLTQPLLELWQIRSANDVAAAETRVARNKAQGTENRVALPRAQLRDLRCSFRLRSVRWGTTKRGDWRTQSATRSSRGESCAT